MAEGGSTERSEYLSPEDMQQWLRQELADSAKAFELRKKEATELVTAYATGKISPEEAEEKHWRYEHRWGEALPGTHTGMGISDEEILAAIDKAQGQYTSPKESRERFKKLFGQSLGQTGPVR